MSSRRPSFNGVCAQAGTENEAKNEATRMIVFRISALPPPHAFGATLQLFEQHLSLCDLGHFGRRREALERWLKNGVRVGGTGGRLVELGERERRAQAEAPRPLSACDFHSAAERGLGG